MDASVKQIPVAFKRAQAAFKAGNTLRAVQYASLANELAAANVARFDYDMEKVIDAALPGFEANWRLIILAEFQRTFMILSVFGENTAVLHGLAERGQSFTQDTEGMPQLVELIYTAKTTSTFLDIIAFGATHARQKMMALFRYYESHHAKAHFTKLERLADAAYEGKARTFEDDTKLVGYELALMGFAYLSKPETITPQVAFMSASVMLNFVRVRVEGLRVTANRSDEVSGDCLVDNDYDPSYELLAPILIDDTAATFYCLSPVADTTWLGDAYSDAQQAMTAHYGDKARTVLMTPPDRSARALQ